ncbi:MAG TPA: DJ-1/PfpI family protein [Candidatus Acidoferrales bacterium]|nr:DJ-1/PfpI family protein [Candidatus Acidoferrales bacterium]
MADKGTACIFVFDGFADWEPASALAELRRTFGFSVQAIALAKHRVTSMGGLEVIPSAEVSEVRADAVDILILPGGEAWMRGEIPAVTALVRSVTGAGRPVAAICAATLALAHAGLLDERRHTSNGEEFISRYAPAYRGHRLYQKARAVTDGNVITANGLAPFAFAAEIFRAVAPERPSDIAAYEALYSRGMVD